MKVHRSQSVRPVRVTTDGEGVVSHAGIGLLAEMADRSGLTEAMSVAMADCGIDWHTHDPGVVLTHMAVAIADGADCLSHLAVLATSPSCSVRWLLRPRRGERCRRWPRWSCGLSPWPVPLLGLGCGLAVAHQSR